MGRRAAREHRQCREQEVEEEQGAQKRSFRPRGHAAEKCIIPPLARGESYAYHAQHDLA
jgi:hypothetical protein